jgi:hypothetical protein
MNIERKSLSQTEGYAKNDFDPRKAATNERRCQLDSEADINRSRFPLRKTGARKEMSEEIFRAYSHKPAFGMALSEPQTSNHLKRFNNARNALTFYLFRPTAARTK